MRLLLAVVALSFAAVTMSSAQSSKQAFPGANPAMPFSAAVKADGLVYVSGTLGSNGDIKAQTKQVLSHSDFHSESYRASHQPILTLH